MHIFEHYVHSVWFVFYWEWNLTAFPLTNLSFEGLVGTARVSYQQEVERKIYDVLQIGGGGWLVDSEQVNKRNIQKKTNNRSVCSPDRMRKERLSARSWRGERNRWCIFVSSVCPNSASCCTKFCTPHTNFRRWSRWKPAQSLCVLGRPGTSEMRGCDFVVNSFTAIDDLPRSGVAPSPYKFLRTSFLSSYLEVHFLKTLGCIRLCAN